MKNSITRSVIPTLSLCAILLLPASAKAEALQQSISLGKNNNRQEQLTQQRIDQLSEQTRAMLDEYHVLNRELEALSVYNDQLQRLTTSQEEEKALIHQQMEDIELTQQEIMPLMLRMIEHLNDFVINDTPFLRKERMQRISLLRQLMDRSDVSVAEKYRRVLGAYQVELDYGRTLEAYREDLEIDGIRRNVQFLRIGRVGWYYQTLDGHQAAHWDAGEQTWVPVKATQRLAIRRALRVASQQAAPELLNLPVAAAKNHEPE
ncbi:MAG: DUF3450 domain-containing protein [Thiogranum sp.]